MEPSIVEQPSLRAGCLRHVGAYTGIGQAFERLTPILKAAGLLEGHFRLIGIYHDDPAVTPPDKLRSDAGILLGPGLPLPPGLAEVTLPAGRYAHLRHVGPYDRLPESWSRIKGPWLTSHGRRRDGPSYEIYLNTPMTAAPADLLTDIFVPVT